MDLYEALAAKTETSVVLLTGWGDIAMGVRAMKARAVDFLSKPVKRELLLKAVQRAVIRARVAGSVGATSRRCAPGTTR